MLRLEFGLSGSCRNDISELYTFVSYTLESYMLDTPKIALSHGIRLHWAIASTCGMHNDNVSSQFVLRFVIDYITTPIDLTPSQ
jgi:uncharacterized membrane protein YkvA (DUF1232 family)